MFDISNLPKIQNLQIAETKIDYIDVSQNPELQSLDITNTKISELDVSGNPELMALYCANCDNVTRMMKLPVAMRVLY